MTSQGLFLLNILQQTQPPVTDCRALGHTSSALTGQWWTALRRQDAKHAGGALQQGSPSSNRLHFLAASPRHSPSGPRLAGCLLPRIPSPVTRYSQDAGGWEGDLYRKARRAPASQYSMSREVATCAQVSPSTGIRRGGAPPSSPGRVVTWLVSTTCAFFIMGGEWQRCGGAARPPGEWRSGLPRRPQRF